MPPLHSYALGISSHRVHLNRSWNCLLCLLRKQSHLFCLKISRFIQKCRNFIVKFCRSWMSNSDSLLTFFSKRQNYACFYTLSKITRPQGISWHQCNSRFALATVCMNGSNNCTRGITSRRRNSNLWHIKSFAINLPQPLQN